MTTFTTIFLAALLLSVSVQLWLTSRHMKHVSSHRRQVPAEFAGKLSLEEHQKAADYTLANARYGSIDLLYSSALLLLWTLGGGLDWLDDAWRGLDWGTLTTGVGFMVSAFLLMSLLDVPFSAYHTFVIEQRFGFNKMTAGLFVADQLKEALLTLIIGVPLAYVVLWLMEYSGSLWWLYVWLVWIGFTMFMLWAYPAWIAPLFNKFSPLADQALETRIDALLKRCGFSNNGIFVMDGSKRSGHGNAYFTGFGSNKRIVFFDTLIKNLSGEEIEAVLAHELGHFKHRHVIKRMITMAGVSLLALALLGWLMQQAWFFQGLGISHASTYAALMLFVLVAPVFSIYFQPLSSFIMRKHEFEADDYASKQSSAADLIKALVKLYRENSSTLTPDPLYSAFHDSHPPAPIRIAFLSSKLKQEVSS
jgi:STE24 endopeptidase